VKLKKNEFSEIIGNLQKRAKDALKSERSPLPLWTTLQPNVQEFLECDE